MAPQNPQQEPQQGQKQGMEILAGGQPPADPQTLEYRSDRDSVPTAQIQEYRSDRDAAPVMQTLAQGLPGATTQPQSDMIPPFPRPKPVAAPAGPRPGSFGWKLAQTLKGVQIGLSGLGDAGAVGTVPEGGGWLTGAARTAGAATERARVEQARKDKLAQEARENTREDWKAMSSVAMANAQMRHEQYLTWTLGDKAMDDSIANGQQMVSSWKSGIAPSEVLQTGVTRDQITAMLNQKDPDGKPVLDPTQYTAFPDGKKVVDEKDGLPVHAMTYSIMKVPQQYMLTDKDQSWLNVLHGAGIKPEWKPGTTVPGYIANALNQQSQNIKAATASRNKTASDLDFANEYDNFSNGQDWVRYLAQAGPYGPALASQMFMSDYNDPNSSAGQTLRAKYSTPMRDIQSQYATKEDPTGAANWAEKVWKPYLENVNKTGPIGFLNKIEGDPSELAGDKSTAAIDQLQGMLRVTKEPVLRTRITGDLKTAQDAHEHWQDDLKNKALIDDAVKQGDPKVNGRLLAQGVATLTELKNRGVTGKSLQESLVAAEGVYEQEHPGKKFSAAQWEIWDKQAGSATNLPFFSGANTLLSKNGTLDQLLEAGEAIPKSQYPAWNKVEDLIQAAQGSGPLAEYASLALGVAYDYARVQGGGSATEVGQRTAEEKIVASLSPAGRVGSVYSIRNAVRRMRDERIGVNPFLENNKVDEFMLAPPKGMATVFIPGTDAPKFIPKDNLLQFRTDNPNAQWREEGR